MAEIIKTTDDRALVSDGNYELMEKVLLGGDLSQLSPRERMGYYSKVCESLGLNPATRPFDYIKLNGKLTLYVKKDATEQLRKINGVSITGIDKDWKDNLGLYIVTAHAQDGSGRLDAATGAVSVKGLSGEPLANAIMKAETKAKRRVTLSICGLGFLDESEVSSIPGARMVGVTDSGDISEMDERAAGGLPGTSPVESEADHRQHEPPSVETVMVTLSGRSMIKNAKEAISARAAQSFMELYVGDGKKFHPSHLKNHLRTHFHVDALGEMTWRKLVALISHAEGKGDDPEYYGAGETTPKAPGENTDLYSRIESLGMSVESLEEILGKSLVDLSSDELGRVGTVLSLAQQGKIANDPESIKEAWEMG